MKVLNLGSLNIDHVYSVDHVVAPGETISAKELHDYCGGKGFNQSIAMAKAGVEVYHAGKVGSDGVLLVDYLNEHKVDTSLIIVDSKTVSGHAIIQVQTDGQNSIVVFGGANTAITEAEVDGILASFGAGDLLLLQNEVNVNAYAIRVAKRKGITVAMNPSPMGDLAGSGLTDLVDILILNEIEGYQITGEKDPEKICDALLKSKPDRRVVLTLGENGSMYADAAQRIRQGIFRVKAVDTTAAGDTYLGYFLAGLIHKADMREVLRSAAKASAIAASRHGASASIPLFSELDECQLEEIGCKGI